MILALTLILSIMPILFFAGRCQGCTCIVVGKKASSTGSVLVGHNEDDGGLLDVRHHIVSPDSLKTINQLHFEPNKAILESPTTNLGYIWSEVRGLSGMSGSDCFYNERGVFIASDNCRPSSDIMEPTLDKGGIVYGIRQIVAATAKSSKEGVNIAIELLEKYGYGDSGRCYIIADKDEAWLLQAIKGKHYCAKKVPDDEVAFIPNHYTIREAAGQDIIISKDFESYTKKLGIYEGKDGVLDFARTAQAKNSTMMDGNMVRHREALYFITGENWDEESDLPFSIRPRKKLGLFDIKGLLRTHYEDRGHDKRQCLDYSPHWTDVRRICTGTTLESIIVNFRDDPMMTTLWTAGGHPCSSPYVPVYGGIIGVAEESIKDLPIEALRRHFHLTEKDFYYHKDDPWWIMEKYQTSLGGQYDDKICKVRSHLEALEAKWFHEEEDVIREAQSLMTKSLEEARIFLTKETSLKYRESIFFFKYINDNILETYDIWADRETIHCDCRSEEIQVTIEIDEKPAEESLLFGQIMSNGGRWATAISGSLSETTEGRWSVRFRSREATDGVLVCENLFFLYGKTFSGKNLVGSLMLKVEKQQTS